MLGSSAFFNTIWHALLAAPPEQPEFTPGNRAVWTAWLDKVIGTDLAQKRRMFIHFDLERGVRCDDCGSLGTVMCLLTGHSDRSLNLCTACCKALAQTLSHSLRKLRETAVKHRLDVVSDVAELKEAKVNESSRFCLLWLLIVLVLVFVALAVAWKELNHHVRV
jgi:hypothetical protein